MVGLVVSLPAREERAVVGVGAGVGVGVFLAVNIKTS